MKLYPPAYLRPSVRISAIRPPTARTLAKAASIALALAGLVLINASQHVYSSPDSLGVAYNDLGGIDIIDRQPALFVCNNGPLAQALPWFDVDC